MSRKLVEKELANIKTSTAEAELLRASLATLNSVRETNAIIAARQVETYGRRGLELEMKVEAVLDLIAELTSGIEVKLKNVESIKKRLSEQKNA